MRTALPLLLGAAPAGSHVALTPGRMFGAVMLTILACIPIGLSLWALLDAVHHPQWAWALTPHRQVAWLIAILFGMFTLVVGLAISLWYLLKIRPTIAAAEQGKLDG